MSATRTTSAISARCSTSCSRTPLDRLPGQARGCGARGQTARPRVIGVPGVDRRAAYRDVDMKSTQTGSITVSRNAGDGAGARDLLHAAYVTEVLAYRRQVRIVQGDTDRANGRQRGSRSASSAARPSSRRPARDQRRQSACCGRARSGGRGHRIPRRTLSIAGTIAQSRSTSSPRASSAGFAGVGDADAIDSSWPNGVQACEVEIDRETGEVKIAAIASCDDVGRIINHISSRAGARRVAKAPGRRCTSRRSTMPRAAAPDRVADGLLRAARPDLPRVRASFDESVPCKTTCLASKAAASSARSVVPAVVHAVLDASACSTWTCRSPPRGSGARLVRPADRVGARRLKRARQWGMLTLSTRTRCPAAAASRSRRRQIDTTCENGRLRVL